MFRVQCVELELLRTPLNTTILILAKILNLSTLSSSTVKNPFCKVKDVRDRKILHKEFFFKVQYIIIQAILCRKSMKKNHSYR